MLGQKFDVFEAKLVKNTSSLYLYKYKSLYFLSIFLNLKENNIIASMKVSKQTKEFLKKNRKKYSSKKTEEDTKLQQFINSGGREGVEKDFNNLLKKAVKGK